MDGERKECPIVPNEAIKVNLSDDEDDYIVVSATHDSIQSFSNNEYDYLRYYDQNTGELKAFWFSSETLADLYDFGIPLTYRDNITNSEYELFCQNTGKTVLKNLIDIEEIVESSESLTNDPVEEEVQKAHEHIDAELSYYLKEWLD